MTTTDTVVAITNRTGATRKFTVTDADRRMFAARRPMTDEEIAVVIATGAGHVKRLTNPLSVVRVDSK